MKINLINNVKVNTIPLQTLSDLELNRVIASVTSRVDLQRNARTVLCNLQNDASEIIRRQDILKDFIANKGLLEEIRSNISGFIKIKSEWLSIRNSMFYKNNENSKKLMDRQTAYFYSNVKVVIQLLNHISSFNCCMQKTTVTSDALNALAVHLSELTASGWAAQFKHFLDKYNPKNAAENTFVIDASFGGNLNMLDATLIDINLKKSLFSKEPKSLYKEDWCVKNEIALETIVSASLCPVNVTLENIILALSDFEKLDDDLQFYEFGLLLLLKFQSNNIPFCFPEIDPEDKCTNIENLYDMFLVLNNINTFGYFPEHIIANNVSLSVNTPACMIKGAAGSGKTIYLRSIGVAQLFAQAGLPLPASGAVIGIKDGIFTQFSTNETEIGRFEEEVKQMRMIVDKAKPHSLILLNETFQSTSFEEAAQGLSGIIIAFIKMDDNLVIVSHIDELFNMKNTIEENTNGKQLKIIKFEYYKANI